MSRLPVPPGERSAYVLKDVHVGRSAVVLGAGPSLRFVNERVCRHVTIAINAAVELVPKPDYLLSSDGFLRNMTVWKTIHAAAYPLVLRYYNYFPPASELGVDPARLYRFEVRAAQVPQTIRPNVDDGFVHGYDAAQFATYLAAMMGCSPIYLLGCDTGPEDGKHHFWEFDGRPAEQFRPRDEWEVVLPDQARGGRTPQIFFDKTREHWRRILAENPDLDVRDASGGELHRIVPSASLREVLG